LEEILFIGTPLKSSGTTLSNSDYVDFACFDLTDFADNINTADFTKNGVVISPPSHDLTFTDIRIHGIKDNGILGTTGGNLTMTDVQLMGNGNAGWDADQGQGTTGWGNTNVTNFQIEASGCYEEYPIVDAFPYRGCGDDLSGIYSDGFGTTSVNSPVPGWTLKFDQGIADYNTQDGIDCLHTAGDGSSCSVTRTLAYGNMGQQIKIGGGGTVANNVINGNCAAMNQAIPGFPAGTAITSWSISSNVASFVTAAQTLAAGNLVTLNNFPTSTFFNGVHKLAVSATGLTSTTFQVPFTHANGSGTETGVFTTWNGGLSSFCRAANTAVVIEIPPATTSYFENNTIYSSGNVAVEIEPYDELQGGQWVGTEGFRYKNNVSLDFSTATPIFNQSQSDHDLAPLTNAGGAWTNNATYQPKSGWACPATGESNAICVNPGLIDETYHSYGYGNVAPASGSSAVVGAGTTISGITLDFAGVTRSLTAPTIGAYEDAVAAILSTVTVTPNPGSAVVGGTATFAASCLYSDGSTSPCTITWTDTAAHSSVGATTGVVTGVSAGTDTITATMSSVNGTATVTISSPSPMFQGSFLIQGKIN
jgi:hypothetical protein